MKGLFQLQIHKIISKIESILLAGKTVKLTSISFVHGKNTRNVILFVFGFVDEVRLGPGSYNHTFSFTLPLTIPSSIFGKYGYVRCDVCVAFDVPWQQDTKFKYPFTDLNLNQFPILS